jgi:hypothetical protein
VTSREEEFRYFAAFREARPDLSLDVFEHRDRPDFMVSMDGSRIGIEVTRYSPEVNPGVPRPEEQVSLQHWTLELARDMYFDAGGPPISVHAVFDRYRVLTKKRARELAEQISTYLLGSSKKWLVYRRREYGDLVRDKFLPELASLDAIRVSPDRHAAWITGQVGWSLRAQKEDIRRVALRKENKLAAYRKSCDAIWLLIVFDILGNEFEMRPPVEPVEFAISTGFDRIFCLAPERRRCVEVPVTR